MCFLIFKWNFLYFDLYLVPLLLSLNITKTSLSQASFFLPTRYLYTLVRSTLGLFFCGLNSCSLWSWNDKYYKMWIFVTLCWTLQSIQSYLGLGSPEMDPALQMSRQCWLQRKDHLPQATGNSICSASQDAVDLLGCQRLVAGLFFKFQKIIFTISLDNLLFLLHN